MSYSSGFGHRLRDARVRKGMDFNTVARRLRIRPGVLRAIEEENFSNMPPRGYARNMINSYARFLGLNASDITQSYLEAQANYDSRVAQRNARGTGFDMEPSGRITTARNEYEKRTGEPFQRHDSSTRYMSERTRSRLSREGGSINGLGRRVYSEDVYSPEREQLRSQRATAEANRAHRDRQRAPRRDSAYLNVYGDNVSHNSLKQYLPFVGIGVVILILILIVLIGSLIFGGGKSEETTDIPTKNLENELVSRLHQSAPSSFAFSYEVADGSEAWLEITVDGESKLAESVSGPASETFECGSEVKFAAGSMDGVTIKVDGQEVEPKTDKKGNITYTMKLSTILDQWVADHSGGSSSSAASGSSSSSASSSSSDDSKSSSTE